MRYMMVAGVMESIGRIPGVAVRDGIIVVQHHAVVPDGFVL